MKQNIVLLFLFFFGFVNSQRILSPASRTPDTFSADTLGISNTNVYYNLTFKKDQSKTDKLTEVVCILQIGDNYSRFSENNKFKLDSISEKFSRLDKINSEQLNQILQLKTFWKIDLVKSKLRKNIVFHDYAFGEFEYEEPLPIFNWELVNETKNILGFVCKKATTQYRGRKYIAWYNTNLPIVNGPFVFEGLPGLIMEIEDSKNHYHFVAIAIESKSNPIIIRTDKRIIKTTREKFRKTQEAYFDNPGQFLGKFYDNENGPALNIKLKSKPYNPIELE